MGVSSCQTHSLLTVRTRECDYVVSQWEGFALGHSLTSGWKWDSLLSENYVVRILGRKDSIFLGPLLTVTIATSILILIHTHYRKRITHLPTSIILSNQIQRLSRRSILRVKRGTGGAKLAARETTETEGLLKVAPFSILESSYLQVIGGPL